MEYPHLYLLTFLEGVIAFVSPCILPMLPIYISFFAGDDGVNRERGARVIYNACAFVLGMALVFILMGAAAGALGFVVNEHRVIFNIFAGLLLLLFGLNYLGVFRLAFLNKTYKLRIRPGSSSLVSSFLFGLVFSIGWSPCLGPLLGAALIHAGTSGETLQGVIMLALFSLGLGLPLILSAFLLDNLKHAFEFIKKHYRVINIAAGSILCLIGVLMIFGVFGKFMELFLKLY